MLTKYSDIFIDLFKSYEKVKVNSTTAAELAEEIDYFLGIYAKHVSYAECVKFFIGRDFAKNIHIYFKSAFNNEDVGRLKVYKVSQYTDYINSDPKGFAVMLQFIPSAREPRKCCCDLLFNDCSCGVIV